MRWGLKTTHSTSRVGQRDTGHVCVSGRFQCSSSRSVQLYDLHDTVVPYEQAWRWQKARLNLITQQLDASTALTAGGQQCAQPQSEQLPQPTAQVLAAAAETPVHVEPPAPPHSSSDALFILQHQPVYTLGAGSSVEHLRFPLESPPFPLHRTERGGEVTYHGPGQLVMYPILDLKRNHTPDLHAYMRSLEQVVIDALEAVSGLQGERLPGLTGVWVGGRKVAAIGVRARKWVTYHGLALNVTTDLAPFNHIVPCGIEGRSATSVQQLLAESAAAGCDRDDDDILLSDFAREENRQQQLAQAAADAQSSAALLRQYRTALLDAFSGEFDVEFENGDVRHLV